MGLTAESRPLPTERLTAPTRTDPEWDGARAQCAEPGEPTRTAAAAANGTVVCGGAGGLSCYLDPDAARSGERTSARRALIPPPPPPDRVPRRPAAAHAEGPPPPGDAR